MMKRFAIVAVALSIVVGLAGCSKGNTGGQQGNDKPQAPPAQAAKELVVAGYGGTFEKAFKETVIPAFEKQSGAKVTYVTGVSTATLAKLQAQKDKPEIDVAVVDDGPQAQAKALGLLEKLDPAKVTNLGNLYDIAREKDGVGVGIGVVATGIGYNTKVFKDKGLPAPTSWGDLANPAFKGRVVLQSITTTYGVHHLVMAAKMNGGGESSIDPGFQAIKDYKANVVTFDKTADVSKSFQQGEAWIAPWGSGRVYTLAKSGFPVEFVYPKEGAPALLPMASVVKNAPHPDLAQQFVNFLLTEDVQKVIAGSVFFGPVNKNVKLDPDVAKLVPYGADQIGKLTKIDWATVNAKRADWTERWTKEIETK